MEGPRQLDRLNLQLLVARQEWAEHLDELNSVKLELARLQHAAACLIGELDVHASHETHALHEVLEYASYKELRSLVTQ